MEGEHTLTFIQLILSTDLAIIQLKDSHLILHISQQVQHQRHTHQPWEKQHQIEHTYT